MRTALLISLLFLLSSCEKKGQIKASPEDFIIIHGKVYKLFSIVPKDDCDPIWILYPKDSMDSQPEVINYTKHEGKRAYNQTIVKVD